MRSERRSARSECEGTVATASRLRLLTLVWFLSKCSRTCRGRTELGKHVRVYHMQEQRRECNYLLLLFSVYATYAGVYMHI